MSIELNSFRKTSQFPAPLRHIPTPEGQYDIYPGFNIGAGKITYGFRRLADLILSSHQHHIIIDGYIGVLWDRLRDGLQKALRERGAASCWNGIATAMNPTST